MKKKYIQPNVSVSFVVVESLLQSASRGVAKEEGEDWGTCSKKHDFSSWDWDFDEDDESESNSSSKSLWEN